ncbi:MAG: nucleotidyltransferase family protein [Burkholderiaceae bacterium]
MACHLKAGGGLYSRLRIGAVLLAAGEGRRMGGVAKGLIRLQGVPLLRRQLIALSGAGVDEVIVVTGHAQAEVEKEVLGFSITLAHNDAWADGQDGSVRFGLAALNGAFDAIFIMPSDQPLIAADDLTELISAFKKRAGGHVVVPIVNGQRGNPILLDDEARALIMDSGAKLGCKHLTERHPELVHVHQSTNVRFITDLDTLDDVRLLSQRTGWKLELPVTAAIPAPL